MSRWKLHYTTLAPEVVDVPESYFADGYTEPAIIRALQLGDVQHVNEDGTLQQGASYWSPGSVVKYELLETGEQTELAAQHKVLLTQAEVDSAAAALVAAERASQSAADEAAQAAAALEIASKARAEAEALATSASSGANDALNAIALKAAEASAIVERVKAENADALQALADANSKLSSARVVESDAQKAQAAADLAVSVTKLSVQVASDALSAASRKAAEAQLAAGAQAAPAGAHEA